MKIIKKLFATKISALLTILVFFTVLSAIAAVIPTAAERNAVVSTINPFSKINYGGTDNQNNTKTELDDPVLKFFLQQNQILKDKLEVVDYLDSDISEPQYNFEVSF